MKTSELTGTALDWAVAKCEGLETWNDCCQILLVGDDEPFHPSTDWSQGGPLLDQYITKLEDYGDQWGAEGPNLPERFGPTPLIAAMRCLVASRLGDEVEVPTELL
jgi:hypothetical protein